MAEDKKAKMYNVTILNPALRKKGGKYECWVNGNKYTIAENKPVELKPEVLSHLINHKMVRTVPTDDGAVDMTQGFSTEQQSSFNVVEL